jgi:hypothetical protein
MMAGSAAAPANQTGVEQRIGQLRHLLASVEGDIGALHARVCGPRGEDPSTAQPLAQSYADKLDQLSETAGRIAARLKDIGEHV